MTEYVIEKLGQHGDGVFNLREADIFAPQTLVGEHVTGIINGTQLTDIRITKPSDQRIKPVCKHFKSCGGCSLQHMHPDTLADWKVDQVRTVLSLEGLDTDFLPLLTSPTHSRRRATFVARRTKKNAMVGFHARASDAMIEIQECPLIEPALLSGLQGLREITSLLGTRKGSLRIATTETLNGLDVSISEGKELSPTDSAMLGQIAAKYKFCRISWNEDVIVQAAPATVNYGVTKMDLPLGAFLQATKHGEDALVNAALNAITGSKSIVDLFAGCGTFALQAARTGSVHAVEGDADMTKSLDAAWRGGANLKPLTSETRDLFERPLLQDELDKFDAAIIDPPRSGAQVQTKEIAASKISKIGFVSCNPGTFARDAKILVKAGFKMNWIQVVDQFRWSPHIELVASFSR